MGLSSLPSPSEGVLCVILVNTALSFSIVKGIVLTILHIVGINLPSSSSSTSSQSPNPSTDYHENPSESIQLYHTHPNTYIEEFRTRTPTFRFNTICGCKPSERDCSVCLTEFEPESEINHLSCGHVFHKVCLEKCLDHWNITCPLCRTPLLPEEDVSCIW